MSIANGFRVSKMPFPTKPAPLPPPDVGDALLSLRQKIDRVDDALYELLALRMLHSRDTRVFKKITRCPIRENEVMERLCQKKEAIDRKMVREIWSCIFKYSRDAQDRTTHATQLVSYEE
jgi:chorismate mutase